MEPRAEHCRAPPGPAAWASREATSFTLPQLLISLLAAGFLAGITGENYVKICSVFKICSFYKLLLDQKQHP